MNIDAFAIGEHHRKDFAVSAPEIVLAAAASKTKQIHLSTINPIRVYEQYATIDAIAPGRVEIMAGRGSFTEAFDLFGYDLENYDELFIEKLEMLLKMNKEGILDWKKGKFTPEVDHKEIYPRTKKPIPISVATSGSIELTIRTAKLGLPIFYAIIGGDPLHFKPLIRLYKRVTEKIGNDLTTMPIAAHSWGWLNQDK